jgi:hypothetical protein
MRGAGLRARELRDFFVTRNRFFALTVTPNVVASSTSEKTPAAFRQTPLEIPTLHGDRVYTYWCAFIP